MNRGAGLLQRPRLPRTVSFPTLELPRSGSGGRREGPPSQPGSPELPHACQCRLTWRAPYHAEQITTPAGRQAAARPAAWPPDRTRSALGGRAAGRPGAGSRWREPGREVRRLQLEEGLRLRQPVEAVSAQGPEAEAGG